MKVKIYEFQESKQFTGVGTVYTGWVNVGISANMLAFIKLTAQGTFTDETLNISVQTRTPEGDAVDLADNSSPIAFTEITNKISSLPFLDYIPFTAFGSLIRFKIVTAGTSPDYTFKLTGYGKG